MKFRVVIAVIVAALLGTAWVCRYETMRIGSRGYVLRINRWTGKKYLEHPWFDSDSGKWFWIVSPLEPPAPPPPAVKTPPSPAPTRPPARTSHASLEELLRAVAKPASTRAPAPASTIPIEKILAEPAPAQSSSSGR